MSKCFIEFRKTKDKDGNIVYKDINLRANGIFVKRTYNVDNIEDLISELKENKINYEKKNGKRIITDKDVVFKYSKKASEISRKNNYKRAIFTAATISSLAIAALSSNKTSEKKEDVKPQIEVVQDTPVEANIDKITVSEDLSETNQATTESTTFATTEINTANKPTEKIEVTEEEKENAVFDVNYEDRSSSEYVDIINEKYGEYIEKYSEMYGIDKNLVVDIIIQENKTNEKNYTDVGGYGLMQVESIWDGEELYSYNFTLEEYEKVVVDTARARDDDEYSIKIGCMIYNNYYQFIRSEYYLNSDTLTEEECVIASLFAYNKGIGIVMDSLDNFTDFETFLNDVRNTPGGDSEYVEHVLSYQTDKTITNRNKDGSTTSIDINITDLSYDDVSIKR